MNWSPSVRAAHPRVDGCDIFLRPACVRPERFTKKAVGRAFAYFQPGLLIFFKYFYLIYDTASAANIAFSASLCRRGAVTILLPVGISFLYISSAWLHDRRIRGDIECERDFCGVTRCSSHSSCSSSPADRTLVKSTAAVEMRARVLVGFMRSGGTLILWACLKSSSSPTIWRGRQHSLRRAG